VTAEGNFGAVKTREKLTRGHPRAAHPNPNQAAFRPLYKSPTKNYQRKKKKKNTKRQLEYQRPTPGIKTKIST
jgi:hypothetical protein